MADEPNTPAARDATKPVEESARDSDAIAEPAVAESKPTEGGAVATEDVAEVPKSDDAQAELVANEKNNADTEPSAGAAGNDADDVPASDGPTSNGTPAAKKANNGRRKSATGVPEHKKKTPAKGKKKAPELRLNVSAGEMYMVAMRGYQPWPVIVCDEEMLPESLLSKRPVSAKRIDGTYREDYADGGKNAKDRRYPVMFLGTNEFAWQVNTELLHFDLEEVKKDVESGNQGKRNKNLWEAYQVAAEGHDLPYFKNLLTSHEEAMQQDAEQREQKEQEKKEKKEKKEKAAKRKSIAVAESEDVDMEAAGEEGAPKKAKASKKRKKSDESDGENEKPAKTPKTKLKLTTKTPKEGSAAKPKKETKPKKKSSEEAEPTPIEEPPLTEEERLQKREKQVLYLRHRLQKGFLARDQAPKDEDMSNMSEYIRQLEAHEDLEAEIIKKTKVHKVLRAIVKLNTIPKEEEFEFKTRSQNLLQKWNTALAADAEQTPAMSTATGPKQNGVKHDGEDKKLSESTKEDSPTRKEEGKKDNTSAEPVTASKPSDSDGDISMADADKEASKDVPTVSTTADSSGEGVSDTAASANDAATS